MRDFNQQLLRLKQALRVTEDQDVAEILGMTKAAFSARKGRKAFPEDKVKALAADRPELRLDVKYVLTGQSDELERRLAAISKATRAAGKVKEAGARYEVQQAVFETLVAELSPEERMLLQNFRNADAQGRTAILATAAAIGAAAVAPGDAKKGHRKS